MKHFKKNPLFFTMLTSLMLVFVVALAWNVILFTNLSAAELDYSKAEKQYKRVLAQDPSQKAVDVSLENIQEVGDKLDKLTKELSPKTSDIITEAPMKEGYSYVEYLRGLINKLRDDAKDKEIYLNEDECFGYSKYYKGDATPPPDEAIAELWKQSSVLAYILDKLYSSKLAEVPMKIDLVQREVLDVETSQAEAAAATASVSKFKTRRPVTSKRQTKVLDSFAIDKTVSAKVDGSIDTFAYKFTFRTKTDVLRNFLNSLKDFDLMLVVRSVEVSVGLPIEAPVEDEENSSPSRTKAKTQEELNIAKLNEANEPVVRDNMSEFTVTIEYIELAKEPVETETKNEEEED